MGKERKTDFICVYNKETDHQTRIYESELDEYISKGYIRGIRPFTEEHKKNIGKSNKGNKSPFKGIPRDQEVKDKISESKRGIKHSEERRKINSESHKGLSWWNNGEKEVHCKECPEGFVKGRLPMKDSQKEKISKKHKGRKLSKEELEIRAAKEYETKKKNNSFNTSKPEENLYKQLLEQYNGKVIRRYKEERYPFYCDFYIPDEDLFIELNNHWTHGGKPFDPNDKECKEKLAFWEEKAKVSQFYENAIKTWTVRDVEKQRVAKENQLNYKIIY